MKEKFKKEIKNIGKIQNCKFRNKDVINPSKKHSRKPQEETEDKTD